MAEERQPILEISRLSSGPGTPCGRIVPVSTTPEVDLEVARSIPEHLALRYQCIALRTQGDRLLVGMADPQNQQTLEDLFLVTGWQVEPVPMDAQSVWAAQRGVGFGVPPVPPVQDSCLPLEEVVVEAHLSGPLASVQLTQRFSNPLDKPLEAVYAFPIPAGAVVHQLRLVRGQQILEGQVEKRQQPEQTHSEALLSLQLGVLDPGQEVVVELGYAQRLDPDGFRLPLGGPTRAQVSLTLDTPPLKLACSQPVEWRSGSGPLRLELAGALQPGDFVLAWEPTTTPCLLVGDRHFLLSVQPDSGLIGRLRLVDRGLNFVASGLSQQPLPELGPGQPLWLSGFQLGKGPLELVGRASTLAPPPRSGLLDEAGEWRLQVQPTSCDNPALPILWAQDRVALLEQRLGSGSDAAVIQEIVSLAQRHGLLTRFTGYLLGEHELALLHRSAPACEEAEEPNVRLVNQILTRAMQQGASHVHVEPEVKSMRVRFRVDGVLHDVVSPPRSLQAALVGRFKTLFGLSAKVPVGRLPLQHEGRTWLATASTVPSRSGERVVISLTPREERESVPWALQQWLARSRGVIAVSGPAALPLLRSAVSRLNHASRNLLVVGPELEGPAGPLYVDSIPAMEVDADAVVTTRFDPRLLESKLVVTGLRAPDSRTALLRMLSQPEVAARLTGVVATQCLRRVCCRSGCRQCHHTGYRGTLVLTEVLTVTPALRQALLAGRPGEVWELSAQALELSFLDQAREAVERGETTQAEVSRVLD